MRKGISFSPKDGSRATGGGGKGGNAKGMGALTPSSGKGLLARRGGWQGGSRVFPSHPASVVRMGAEIFWVDRNLFLPGARHHPTRHPPKRLSAISDEPCQNFPVQIEPLTWSRGKAILAPELGVSDENQKAETRCTCVAGEDCA